MAELKLCPFCGGEADCNNSGFMKAGKQMWAVECLNCGMVTTFADTEQEAIEAWNKRTEPERPKGRWIGTPITEGTGACPYFNGNVGDNRHNCVGAPFSCPCKQSSIYGKSTYHCSECGFKVGYSEKSKTNFCSSCGADMRGESDGC